MERVLGLGTGVFIAGFWFFPDGFWHVVWFLAAVAAPALLWRRGEVFHRLWQDPLARLLLAWMVVLLGVSLWQGDGGLPPARRLWTVVDMSMLLVLVAACSRLAPRWGRGWLVGYIAAGAFAVAVSFPWFYGRPAHPFPSARLRDMLVYADGLHPVLTGMMCGFGAVAAAVVTGGGAGAAGGGGAAWRRARRLSGYLALMVLLLGCCYSHSRGAMLATAAAFAALPFSVGWRRTVPAWALFLLVGVAYQLVVPVLTAPAGGGATVASPAEALVDRADGGRLPLYRHLIGQAPGAVDRIVGRGVWGPRSAGPPDIHWDAPHPHSVYLSAFLYGGALGLGVVLVLGGGALRRALALWRCPGPVDGTGWGCLFVFGAVGLAFDGDSLVALWTLPRLEPLLFWVPWAGLGSAFRAERTSVIDGDKGEGKVPPQNPPDEARPARTAPRDRRHVPRGS